MNFPQPAFHSIATMEMRHTGLTNFFIAGRNAGNGILATQEFWEKPVDGRRMIADAPVPWDEKVPEGVLLYPSSGGSTPGSFQTFWVGWFEGATVKALAITQENPIQVPVQSGDRFIHPPVIGWDRKLKWYFFRKEEGLHVLYKHEFSGEIKTQGKVITEKLLALAYEPLFPVAKPIPVGMDTGFKDNGEAVLAWLSEAGGNMHAHTLSIKGGKFDTSNSQAVHGYKPFSKQRIDVWASGEGLVRVAWLMQRTDQDSIRGAEWVVDFQAKHDSLLIQSVAIEKANLQSAAMIIKRRSQPGLTYAFLLSRTGTLYRQYEGRLSSIRDQVPANYDFPIVAGYDVFEAVRNDKGEVYFSKL